MQVEVTRQAMVVRLTGEFTASRAQRLRETVRASAPLARITVDLSLSPEIEDTALVLLARTLGRTPGVKLSLRGVTLHQARVLHYCLEQGQA